LTIVARLPVSLLGLFVLQTARHGAPAGESIITRWRTAAIRLVKDVLWRLMKRRGVLKWTRLISEEHDLFVAAQVVLTHRQAIARGVGFQVVRGPFQGVRYPIDLVDASTLIPKLLGAYEEELHQIIEAVCGGPYRTIVNVGAAEGYYAVGLATRMPAANVYAFEADAKARDDLGAFARENGVAGRMVIAGRCGIGELSRCTVEPHLLVLMDCEGCEWALLNPELVPGLMHSDLLVELHRVRDNDPRTLIQRLFGGSHTIAFVDARRRDTSRYPELSGLREFEREALLLERTAHHEGWAWARAAR
jgi:hypothetical protein